MRIALELKGVEYESVAVHLLKSEQKDPAFVARNPFASVPMLEAEGRDRVQSLAMLEWLDEANPQNPLLPANIEDRYTARELAYAIATETHAPNNLPVLNYLRTEFGASEEQIATWYRHWLASTLNPVEHRLSQIGSTDYLFNAPCLFEVLLIPLLYNARRYNLDLTPMPRLQQIEAACLALPAFQRAHPDNQPDSPDYSGAAN